MTAKNSSRRPARAVVAVLAAVALFTTACGGNAPGDESANRQASVTTTTPSPTTATPTAPSPSPTPEQPGTVITTGDSEFGVMLFDDVNQAIYLFDKETAGRPDCYDDCAAAWPPVLTEGAPQAAGEVRADMLGTVERADGGVQVTYAGHPLYYYANEAPGEVLCHDVDDFGGTWLVVTPSGEPAPV